MPNGGGKRRVLIVDEDTAFRDTLQQDLALAAVDVATVSTPAAARSAVESQVPDLVVLDLALGGAAIELLRRWRAEVPDLVVVMVSGGSSLSSVVDALSEGARRFFSKPVSASMLLDELASPKHELGMAALQAEGVDRFFAISPGLLAIQGFDGYFKMVNPAWEKALGYTVDELCATPYLELVHPDDREKATDEAFEINGGQTVFRFKNRYRCKDGSYRWLAWCATPSPAHQLIYASARDVTASVRMEQGLRHSNELLKRAATSREAMIRESTIKHENLVELDRFKDEVTATLVHDLKNPLSVIVANYDFILECFDGPEDCLEALRDSQSAGQRILRLLTNLVEVARLETTKLEVTPRRASITEIVASIAAQRRVLARTHAVTISIAPCPEIFGMIDADLLTRTIENIIDNALRYAPERGRIEVSVAETGTEVEIRIGNTGRAIPVELREAVFERYGQATATLGSMNLGLGLHFCRMAVEAHGGRIWIEETEPLPTVFAIRLPRLVEVRHVSDGTGHGEVADVGLTPGA